MCVTEMLQCSWGTRREAALQKYCGIRMDVGTQHSTGRIAGAKLELGWGHTWLPDSPVTVSGEAAAIRNTRGPREQALGEENHMVGD